MDANQALDEFQSNVLHPVLESFAKLFNQIPIEEKGQFIVAFGATIIRSLTETVTQSAALEVQIDLAGDMFHQAFNGVTDYSSRVDLATGKETHTIKNGEYLS